MKKTIRSGLMLLVITLLITMLPVAGLAYSVDITSYDTFRNETMGRMYDIDGLYSYQCWDGAALLWQQVSQTLFSNGTAASTWDYAGDNAGGNFTLIYNLSDVKRGDVVVFGYNSNFNATLEDGTPCGHIAFADNNYTPGIGFNIYGQNQVGHPEFTVQYDVNTSNFRGAFRLKRWASPPAYADLTDAKQTYIMPSDNTDLALAVDPATNNVRLETRADTVTQLWSCEKQTDESYIITSLYNGKVLDVDGAGTANGTNVQVYQRWGDNNAAQRWYAYLGNGGNNLAPKLAGGSRLDIDNASLTAGTNLQIWTANGTTAQKFSFYYQNNVVIPTSLSLSSDAELSLRPGETARLAGEFTPYNVAENHRGLRWNSSDEAVVTVSENGLIQAVGEGTAVVTATSVYKSSLTASRTVVVEMSMETPEITALTVSGYKAHVEWTASPLVDERDVRAYAVSVFFRDNLSDCVWSDYNIATTACDIALTEHGEYVVYVWALNMTDHSYSEPEIRNFSVLDSDWLYCDTLPEDLGECEIEYRNHYEDRVSAESPGEGWIQGESHKQYVNGSVKYQLDCDPLKESEELVYLGACYYHYCNHNGFAEHYWTSQCYELTIIDDNGQFEITWTGADDLDSRYTVYLLKWKTGEYAGGQMTCPYHTAPFYRGYRYQQRSVTYTYTWSKPDVWSDEPDPNADAIAYHIREIRYDSVLTLPAELKQVEDEAFMNNTTIQEVVVPAGCTAIGSKAFAGCSGLKRALIPVGVEIAEDAFSGCDDLAIVWIDD